jgi:N4-gp56 family major capsid protein
MAVTFNSVAADSTYNAALDNVVLSVYSKEILFAAQPNLRFEQCAVKKSELMSTPGGTITFLKYNAMTGSSAISELTEVATEILATTTVLIGVTEHIRATQVTERLLQMSMTNVLQDSAAILGQNYGQNRDACVRDAMLGVMSTGVESSASVTCGLPTSVLPCLTATPTTQLTRATITATDAVNSSRLGMEMIRVGVETLATNKAPKFNGDHYLCYVHPHQAAGIRRETGWLSVVQYGDPNRVYKGEIGRIEDVVFIETTMCPIIIGGDLNSNGGATAYGLKQDGAWYYKRGATGEPAAADLGAGATAYRDHVTVHCLPTGHASSNIYVGFLVGDNCVGIADALSVEMRDDGVKNFGRFHSLAYYAMYGTGLIDSGFGVTLETL